MVSVVEAFRAPLWMQSIRQDIDMSQGITSGGGLQANVNVLTR